jgi:poly-beta-1,6-N-acetyl-D-glucosamine synthase
VTGAISGVRRSLFPLLPEGTVLDDVYWPMVVVAKGFRVVHDERAVAFDSLPPQVIGEFRRKVRTLAGNYQLIRLLPALLVPWRNPLWVQFASHKVSRLAAPWMMLSLLSVTGLMVDIPYERAAFVTQVVGYLYACVALEPRWGRRLPLGGAAASFVVVNVAAFAAFWVWLLGGTAGLWRAVSYAPRAKILVTQPGGHERKRFDLAGH